MFSPAQVYGKLVGGEGGDHQHFDWQHSYSRVYPPHDNYTPEGVFMSFAHYNVEVRDRVKCISGAEGKNDFRFTQSAVLLARNRLEEAITPLSPNTAPTIDLCCRPFGVLLV